MRYILVPARIGGVLIQAVFIVALIGYSIQVLIRGLEPPNRGSR